MSTLTATPPSPLPVLSGLKIKMCRYILKQYDLKTIDDYLKYGVPLNADYSIIQKDIVNHSSSQWNPSGIDTYFNTEVTRTAIVGPMSISQF